jgi:hypothetical protein
MNHWKKIPAKQIENSQTKEIFCKHRIFGRKIQLIHGLSVDHYFNSIILTPLLTTLKNSNNILFGPNISL